MDEALILIVDDQPDNSDTIIAYLEETGLRYKFLQALNGHVACKVALKRLPDLIIMDWEMPEMNGYDALVWLKENEETKEIPVVMATGRSSGADLGKALKAGAADYIRKPIERQELLARINSCLSISRYLREIKLKNEELKAYDQMVSHDLRGPISNIMAYAQLLMDTNPELLTGESKRIMETIHGQSKASMNLIDGILSYASAEKEMPFESVDLNSVVLDAIEAHKVRIDESKAVVNAKNLPWINKGVKIKLYQLFYNLVGNALKFQKEDNIPQVSIYLNESNDIIVEDNGVGFDQSKADKIFKPLIRLNNSYEGYGIGLGTCQRIVNIHGWTIRAESEPGIGSKFIISGLGNSIGN